MRWKRSGPGRKGSGWGEENCLEQLGREKSFPERIMVKKGSRYFFVKTAEIILC